MKTIIACPCGNVFSHNKKEYYKIETSVSVFLKTIYELHKNDLCIIWDKCPICSIRGSS